MVMESIAKLPECDMETGGIDMETNSQTEGKSIWINSTYMETGGIDPQRYNPQHMVWGKLTHKAASEQQILTHSTNKAMGFYISHTKHVATAGFIRKSTFRRAEFLRS